MWTIILLVLAVLAIILLTPPLLALFPLAFAGYILWHEPWAVVPLGAVIVLVIGVYGLVALWDWCSRDE